MSAAGNGPESGAPTTGPVLELRGVTKTYAGPPPVHALRSAEVTINRGDYVAVTGPSGSGKSTLLNIVGLLDRPSSGTYFLDGVDTSRLPERTRAALRGQRIGFVFQTYHLLVHRSAAENVMLGLLYGTVTRKARSQLAMAALERVGLTDRAGALPTQMSGGERQRVAIARAVVNRPPLLLCDEPTGNLDSASASVVLELIEELWRCGFTIVVITHDSQVAGRAPRMLSVRDGVVAEGR
ncbi:MAG: ABC transporter ATP-binding protein [Micromonosporaceae bacterium]